MTGIEYINKQHCLLLAGNERWILHYLRGRCAAALDEPKQPFDLLRYLSDVMSYRRTSGKGNSMELQHLRDDLQKRVQSFERWD